MAGPQGPTPSLGLAVPIPRVVDQVSMVCSEHTLLRLKRPISVVGGGLPEVPRKSWLGLLQRFWGKYALNEIVSMGQLMAWACEGASRGSG